MQASKPFLPLFKHSMKTASEINHTKQEDKQIDVTIAAYEAMTPPTHKNDKYERWSTCRSVGGDG
jgi:hypothetical protein